MIQERAMELVAELRSGRHTQAIGKLEGSMDNSRCCLGVACHMMGEVLSKVDVGESISYDSLDYCLPQRAMEYFGFFDDTGVRRDRESLIIDGDSYNSLSGANDANVPFSNIADYIEANWEAL